MSSPGSFQSQMLFIKHLGQARPDRTVSKAKAKSLRWWVTLPCNKCTVNIYLITNRQDRRSNVLDFQLFGKFSLSLVRCVAMTQMRILCVFFKLLFENSLQQGQCIPSVFFCVSRNCQQFISRYLFCTQSRVRHWSHFMTNTRINHY